MRLSVTVAAVCLSLVGLCVADDSKAAIRKSTNIPAEGLVPALKQLAHERNLQVVFQSEVVGTAQTHGAVGELTAQEALSKLLEGTNLVYRFLDDKTITIFPASAAEESGAAPSQPSSAPPPTSSSQKEAANSGAFLLAQAATGQTAIAPAVESQQKQKGTSEVLLQEVIVTAEKRSERLQDVPVSLQVLSGDQLQEQGIVQLSDYAKQVPGLTLIGDSGAGRGVAVLRGVSSGPGSSPLVGVYLDDVPFTPSSPNSTVTNYGGTFDPDLADIERIEVLEGPQSTLYGASTMGGVIKYVTKQPDLNDFAATVRIDGSEVDGGGAGYGVRGSANAPVVAGTIGLRASAFYREDPGFVDNLFTGEKNINHDSVKGARLSLRVKFTDDLETTLSGLVQNIDRLGPDLVYLDPVTLRPALGTLAYSSPIDQPNTIIVRSLSDTTTLNLHFATLTNVASYANVIGKAVIDESNDGTFLGFPPGVFDYNAQDLESRRVSDEIRLTSSPGLLEWLLGGFYTHEIDPSTYYIRGANSGGMTLPPSDPFYNILTLFSTSRFKETAVFGDLTYHWTDRFQATVGMRYSSNDQSYNYTNNGLFAVNALFPDPNVFYGNSGSSNDSAETYLATVTYKPTADMSAYLRAASAYRPGGPNILVPGITPVGVPMNFKSDKLWNYEAGIKGSSWSRRITYSLAAFHMVWTDIQLQVTDASGAIFIGNASSAKSDGVEASLQLAPIDGLTVSAGGAYIDAKLTAPAPPPTDALNDSPLPYAPKVTAAAILDYRWTGFNGVIPHAGLTCAYHGSERTAFTTTAAPIELPAYTTLDLRGGFDWSRYSVIARVDNVTNKYALTDAESSFAAGNPLGGIVIKPRTFGISLQARF